MKSIPMLIKKKGMYDYCFWNLCNGETIAVFQGRNEWGPRALGARSKEALLYFMHSTGFKPLNKKKYILKRE